MQHVVLEGPSTSWGSQLRLLGRRTSASLLGFAELRRPPLTQIACRRSAKALQACYTLPPPQSVSEPTSRMIQRQWGGCWLWPGESVQHSTGQVRSVLGPSCQPAFAEVSEARIQVLETTFSVWSGRNQPVRPGDAYPRGPSSQSWFQKPEFSKMEYMSERPNLVDPNLPLDSGYRVWK